MIIDLPKTLLRRAELALFEKAQQEDVEIWPNIPAAHAGQTQAWRDAMELRGRRIEAEWQEQVAQTDRRQAKRRADRA